MKTFEIVARERFVMFTTYRVKAETAEEAVAMAQNGMAYESCTPDDDPGQWLETVSVETL